MKRAELLVAVVVMLLVVYQPNTLADFGSGPMAFTTLGLILLFLAHRLRQRIKKT